MSIKELAFSSSRIPDWALRRPKPIPRSIYDLLGAPFRMAMFPDALSERVGLTSLRAERFAAILPHLKGRVLDVGAGDNTLIRLYRDMAAAGAAEPEAAAASIGVDVEDWGGGCTIIYDASDLPFEDGAFDTVCFVACINHITNRLDAAIEARRVLRPGGRVLVTMINRLIGTVGHAIWWYSEDKHREVDPEELMGMNRSEVVGLLEKAGFDSIGSQPFVYGLNRLFIGEVANVPKAGSPSSDRSDRNMGKS